MAATGARPYRGVRPHDRAAQRRARLLDAGLSILGCGPDALTVRGVCGRAGVTPRYFYESFTDKDDFVAAVFDWVVADLAATTQAAVATAPSGAQSRAGMASIVSSIVGDPRVGRLLFSTALADAVVVRKRGESGALLATLFGQHVGHALPLLANDEITATSHFAVGGVGQTLSAWLAGQMTLTPEQLVDQLAWFLDRLGRRGG